MIDAIDRRAWVISGAVHVLLVITTLIRIGGSPDPVHGAAASAAPPPPESSTTGTLVLAEDAFVQATVPAALPDRALPQVPILTAASLAPRADAAAQGLPHGQVSRPEKPRLDASSDTLLEELRQQARTAPRDWADDTRRTAATTVQIFIENAFRQRWRQLSTRIVTRTLVLWLQTDVHGRITAGGLFHCSTGVAELDRGITTWLLNEVAGLPRIAPGVPHYIQVELPR